MKGDEASKPEPRDTSQGSGFAVDHVLELQLLDWAFRNENRDYNDEARKVSPQAWQQAVDAINDVNHDDCRALARGITVLDNLLGIADRINTGKQIIVTQVVENRNNDLHEKWNNYLKPIQLYLEANNNNVTRTAKSVGEALKDITGDQFIEDYIYRFLQEKWEAVKIYLAGQISRLGAAGPSPDAYNPWKDPFGPVGAGNVSIVLAPGPGSPENVEAGLVSIRIYTQDGESEKALTHVPFIIDTTKTYDEKLDSQKTGLPREIVIFNFVQPETEEKPKTYYDGLIFVSEHTTLGIKKAIELGICIDRDEGVRFKANRILCDD
ncbi:MAG: hypothetical protein Q9169_004666 [Polycauliona sp. 2 TL-2023]